jgi:hypothetical protein
VSTASMQAEQVEQAEQASHECLPHALRVVLRTHHCTAAVMHHTATQAPHLNHTHRDQLTRHASGRR